MLIVGAILVVPVRMWLVYLPPNASSLLFVETEDPLVALTIDDGPDPVYTPQILDVLEAHGARATFFMTGEHIRAHGETAKMVRDRGHEIGNHGRDHQVLAFASRVEIEKSLAHCDRAIGEVLDMPSPRFVRAPQGKALFRVASVIREQGRVLVAATALGNDWMKSYQDQPETIADLVTEKIEPGGIIALHDGCDDDAIAHDLPDTLMNRRATVGRRDGTVEALEVILTRLKEQDLKAVSVGELLGERPVEVLTEKPAFWLLTAVAILAAVLSFRWCWRVPHRGKRSVGTQG